jgi:hypothetical protein
VFERVFFAFGKNSVVDQEVDEEAHEEGSAGEIRVSPRHKTQLDVSVIMS